MHTKAHFTNMKSLNNNRTFAFGCSKAPISTNGILSTTNHLTLTGGIKSSTFSFDEQVTNAEIIWALSATQRGYSFNSCDDMSLVFRSMFPDSKIAEKFSIQQKKMSYFLSHGLGPYFHRELIDDVKINEMFVLCFDEQTNQQNNKQLDLLLKYWCHKKGLVVTRYYRTALLGHAQVSVLHDFIVNSLKSDGLDLKRLLMLGRDNPSVNKLLEKLIEKEMGLPGTGLLKIGSCNLHVVHNAFRAGNCRVFAETKIHLTPGFSFILRKVCCWRVGTWRTFVQNSTHGSNNHQTEKLTWLQLSMN